MKPFKDRREAGHALGDRLLAYRDQPNVVVLGLARGGVILADELAQALHVPRDVFVVRKLGVPGHPEWAMGALASGGIRVLNQNVLQRIGISEEALTGIILSEQAELLRREQTYRPYAPPQDLREKTVILTDDGLATGATMQAAIQAVRACQAKRVIVAIPVAAPEALARIQEEADETVCLIAPPSFQAVGQWYEQFDQVADDEVRALLTPA